MERMTYSVHEASRLLGVCEATVREAIRKGQIRALRIGRKPRILVPKSAIDRLLGEMGDQEQEVLR
jgi:excisionase family DNA binding protein